jgi:hypothetical protein
MSEFFVSALVVIAILGAAWIGGAVRTKLPEHHLSDETKDMVKVGIGFLATLAAMVLGLLVASAKSSYDTKVEEIQQVAAKLIQLDSNLRELGPQAQPVRARLRQVLADRILPLWDRGLIEFTAPSPTSPTPRAMDELVRALRAMTPSGEVQTFARTRAMELSEQLTQTRWLLVEQSGRTIPMPFLAVLVFWLAAIAASLTLFAPRNGTLVVISIVCAFSFGSAIYLILEMDQPYTGLIKISDVPLRNALTFLDR